MKFSLIVLGCTLVSGLTVQPKPATEAETESMGLISSEKIVNSQSAKLAGNKLKKSLKEKSDLFVDKLNESTKGKSGKSDLVKNIDSFEEKTVDSEALADDARTTPNKSKVTKSSDKKPESSGNENNIEDVNPSSDRPDSSKSNQILSSQELDSDRLTVKEAELVGKLFSGREKMITDVFNLVKEKSNSFPFGNLYMKAGSKLFKSQISSKYASEFFESLNKVNPKAAKALMEISFQLAFL